MWSAMSLSFDCTYECMKKPEITERHISYETVAFGGTIVDVWVHDDGTFIPFQLEIILQQ